MNCRRHGEKRETTDDPPGEFKSFTRRFPPLTLFSLSVDSGALLVCCFTEASCCFALTLSSASRLILSAYRLALSSLAAALRATDDARCEGRLVDGLAPSLNTEPDAVLDDTRRLEGGVGVTTECSSRVVGTLWKRGDSIFETLGCGGESREWQRINDESPGGRFEWMDRIESLKVHERGRTEESPQSSLPNSGSALTTLDVCGEKMLPGMFQQKRWLLSPLLSCHSSAPSLPCVA